MNEKKVATMAPLRLAALIAALVLCLGATAFGFVILQGGAGAESVDKGAVDQLRIVARDVETSAERAMTGEEQVFGDLEQQMARFDRTMGDLESAVLAEELSRIEVVWQPVKRSAQTLVNAGPSVQFMRGLAGKLEQNLQPMQSALENVVRSSATVDASPATAVAAQKTLWLTERIDRNLNRMLAGDGDAEQLAQRLQADSAQLLRAIEGLTRGDASQGIVKVTDPAAIESLSAAFRLVSPVSTAGDRIAEAAPALQQATAARQVILDSSPKLDDAIHALTPAIDKLGAGLDGDSGTLTVIVLVLGLLATALLAMLYVTQYRPSRYTRLGVEAVNRAVTKIGEGDFTVKLGEDHAITGPIARELNASIASQRRLIDGIRDPFQRSVEEISQIGISARAQVEKARELTRSVGESTEAATELVRASEEIKTSTAEATRTAERNCQQVAQGYELTKDMSKASVDVRESVQETSKSAKRQGELIQSVTAAAEYIQALNTKISVVAINTRIEAEKAGEYGRPFLGIAESIADLLREAGEEGRKIISEVRMLQNMSAENLSSMENTVGTVVTILEYIERLDSSLEEINSGSAGISNIISSVDDAAGQSAISALHMKKSMAQIRECSAEIGKLSEATRAGVGRLQRSMHRAASGLGQFRIDGAAPVAEQQPAPVEDLENVAVASRVYREEDMSALESAEAARASV